jgi:hypothetical protein
LTRPSAQLCKPGPVDEVLQQALVPVLRDLDGSGIAAPRIEANGWWSDTDLPTVMLWSPDGGGMGVHVVPTARMSERIASVADQVQEWVIEELWRQGPTNWPRCPRHPSTHPMKALAQDDSAMWVCPVDDTFVAVIGAL